MIIFFMGLNIIFPLLLQINELKMEIEELKKELSRRKQCQMHLMWHCMMYRVALRYVPGGSSALKDTLDAFHENPNRFHSCSCCETEDLNKLLQAQKSENTEQVNANVQSPPQPHHLLIKF